jgi:hypothetical protein
MNYATDEQVADFIRRDNFPTELRDRLYTALDELHGQCEALQPSAEKVRLLGQRLCSVARQIERLD